MQQPFFHQHCLQPISVNSGDGSKIYVPCGHCIACQLSKQSSWAKRLECDIKFGKLFPVFFTLTYNNNNLPLVYYDDDENITKLSFTHTRRLPRNTKKHLPTDVYDKLTDSWYRYERKFIKPTLDNGLLSCDISNFYKPHYVNKRVNNSFDYNTDNTFAICYLPDIQNFIKRLRQTISLCPSLCSENNRFSYFICSEYGPQTYRPHYHGILFFRSRTTAQSAVDRFISLCWGKQDNSINSDNPIASLVMSSEAASSYVSKYVTICPSLPPLFRCSFFKPFKTSSKSLPVGSNAFSLDNVPTMLATNDLFYYKSFIDPQTKESVTLKCTYPDTTFSRVFPKFSFCRLLDASTKYHIFNKLYQIAINIKSSALKEYRLPDLTSFFGEIISITDPIYKTKPVYSYAFHANVNPRDYYNYKSDPDLFITKDNTIFRRHRYYEKKLINTQQSSYSFTPSCFFKSLDDIKGNLDLYLFGIPQNRTACRKIINNYLNLSWCNNPVYYVDLLNTYTLKRFTNSLSHYYDRCLSLPYATPFDIANIYRANFDALPDNLSVMTEEQYDKFDLFISSYGFDITHFYDTHGNKYPYSYLSSDIGINHLKSLNQKVAKQQVIKNHNHQRFNDL